MSSIYNATDGPLLVDDEGHVLAGRDSADGVDVDSSPVAGHISAGRAVLVDTSPADDDTPTPKPPRTRSGSTTTQEG